MRVLAVGRKHNDSDCVAMNPAVAGSADECSSTDNFRGCVRFEAIYQAAVDGTIDESEYARQSLEQELVGKEPRRSSSNKTSWFPKWSRDRK